jgi:hypothetical protein
MVLKFNEHGYPYEDRGHQDLTRRIEELERQNKKLKKRAEEAEGENTIIKGIGNNSPEMKALRKENEELKADLARAKEDHQYDNLVHQNELERLLKKF